jgi:hypothetical protein
LLSIVAQSLLLLFFCVQVRNCFLFPVTLMRVVGGKSKPMRVGDEGIPTSLPSSVDDIAGRVDVHHKPDDLRTGPITRARAKLLDQQVNSLLTEYNLFTNDNFILPKSLHVCIIRFVAEASITRGGEELHEDNRKMVPITSESTREERKARAPPLKKKS